jgi:hypothetical protein
LRDAFSPGIQSVPAANSPRKLADAADDCTRTLPASEGIHRSGVLSKYALDLMEQEESNSRFKALGQDRARNLLWRPLDPINREPATVSEEPSPDPISGTHIDAEAFLIVVIPLTNICNSSEEPWKAKGDRAFVKALLSRAEPKAAIVSHTYLYIHRQVLVCTEVVDDAAAFFTEDHVRVKATLVLRGEGPHPTHSFPTEGVNVGVVLDREWNILSMFRKHDAPPSADIQKRQCIGSSVPYPFHRSGAYCTDPRL